MLALAALAALSAAAPVAHALGVGRLNVQSALGEGMRAEIDITSLSPEEAASLAVRIASPEAYRAAGVDYNAVLSAAPAAPAGQVAAAPAVLQPGPRTAPARRTAAPSAMAGAAAPAPGSVAASPARKPMPAPRPDVAAAPTAGPAAAPASGKRYPVRPGDTLYRVAGKTQPAGVSLDQMLVGLYRANPEAFIANNVNRLRAGSSLSVPTADEVRDVTPADLRQLITAQSVDFSAYRSRLAQGAPLAQAAEPARQAQGKVQASVDDRKQSAAPSPDKLKLSGGAASAADAPAVQPAGRLDNAARVAELSRNVEDLKKLQQGTAAVQAPAVQAPAAAPSTTPMAAAAPPAPSLPAAACSPPWRLPCMESSFRGSATVSGSLAMLRAEEPSVNW